MIINSLVVFCLLTLSLVALEAIARHQHISPAIMRKIVHVGMAILVGISTWVMDYRVYVIVGSLFVLLMIFIRRYYPLRSLADRAAHSYGEIFFPAGIVIAAIFAPTQVAFFITIMILGLADTAAYIVGRSISSKQILYNKTTAGCLAFAATASLVLITAYPIAPAIGIAVAAASIELISPKGSDNLTVPAISVLCLSFA